MLWLGKWNHLISQVHCKRVPFLLTCTNPRKNVHIIQRCDQHLKQTYTTTDFVTPVLHHLSRQMYPLQNRKLTTSGRASKDQVSCLKKRLIEQSGPFYKTSVEQATCRSSFYNGLIRLELTDKKHSFKQQRLVVVLRIPNVNPLVYILYILQSDSIDVNLKIWHQKIHCWVHM